MRPLGLHPFPEPTAPHPCLCGDLTPMPVVGGLLSLTLPGLGSQKQSQEPWDRWWWEGPPRRHWWGVWGAERQLDTCHHWGLWVADPWKSLACRSAWLRSTCQHRGAERRTSWMWTTRLCLVGPCRSEQAAYPYVSTAVTWALRPGLLRLHSCPWHPQRSGEGFWGGPDLGGSTGPIGSPRVGGPPGQVSNG